LHADENVKVSLTSVLENRCDL